VINNTNTTLQLNLTVQNNTLDGKYEGYLKYKASNNAALIIPFETTIKTSTLVVNGTVQSSTITIPSNIGLNNTYALNITFNNTGSYDMPFSFSNSTNKLLMLGPKNITFYYAVSPVNNSLAANSNGSLDVTINLTVANTSDTQGIYEGFILFDANNTSNSIYLSNNGSVYSTYNVISSNNLHATQTNKSAYHIREQGTSDDYNLAIGNVCKDAVTAQISMQGTNSVRGTNIPASG